MTFRLPHRNDPPRGSFRPAWFCVILYLLALLSSPGFADEFYTWTDEKGNVHITDSLSSVPANQRGQAERKQIESAPAPDAADKAAPGLSEPSPVQNGGAKPKQYVVPYTAYEGSARRIIVTARLNGKVTARLAMDTGAPDTVITVPLANKLGLYDNDHGKLLVHASGIGGTVPAVRTIIDTIEVGGAQISFIPTTITPKLSDAFDGLLGMDFVASYAVTIDTTHQVVIFEELPGNPDYPGGHDKEWWTSLFREFAEYRTQWRDYSRALDKKIRNALAVDPEDREKKAFADEQYREADKLFDKLNQYARENAVPMHWRQY